MKRILLTLVVVLALGACGDDPLEQGRVVGRDFEPEHEEEYEVTEYRPEMRTSWEETCYGVYPDEVCFDEQVTEWTQVPYYVERCCRTVPDRWYLTVEDTSDTDGDPRRSRVRVDEATFEECDRGRIWSEDEGCPPA